MLIEANYCKTKTSKLIKGFKEGFDIGYCGPMQSVSESENIPLKIGTQGEMWNKVMKEVKEKRYAGPFTKQQFPFKNYIQSPIGLVPKAGNKTRLIFHLSYNFGEEEHQQSLNYQTPHDICTIKYNDLDCAIRNSVRFLKDMGAEQLFYAKSDCSNAFRILPVKILQHCLLVIKMKHPSTKELLYFIDKCLPFGASISCTLFQEFSDALKFLMEWRIERVFQMYIPITNYLDDFLFVVVTLLQCNQQVHIFLDICARIGCPISEEKTEWSSYEQIIIIFLGILLNGRMLTLSIPIEKKTKALNLLNYTIDNRRVTIKFVQRLTGILNFLNKAIVPGRAFTRGMYQKLALKMKEGIPLKQYHHVYLNKDFILDCMMWKQFLLQDDRTLCRPFVDLASNQWSTFDTISFYSDASLKKNLGMGAVYENEWLQCMWNPDFVQTEKPSIEFLELFALTMAIVTWGSMYPGLQNRRIQIFCNNEVVVHMVNNSASSCYQCRKLIRILTIENIKFNRLAVRHVRSRDNILSDALSRNDMRWFWKYAPSTMNPGASKVDCRLWPIEKVWFQEIEYLKGF